MFNVRRDQCKKSNRRFTFIEKLYLEVSNLTKIYFFKVTSLICFIYRLVDEEQSSMKRSFHLPYTSQGRNQGFNHLVYHRYSAVSGDPYMYQGIHL